MTWEEQGSDYTLFRVQQEKEAAFVKTKSQSVIFLYSSCGSNLDDLKLLQVDEQVTVFSSLYSFVPWHQKRGADRELVAV